MKEYIILSSETFLWFNSNYGLFYNAKEKTTLKFQMNERIHKYCTEINDPINMYAILLEEKDKEDKLFSSWIADIEKSKMGYLCSVSEEAKKPFSFPPIVNMTNEIEESQINENKYYSSINIADCLNEMSFFLGGKELPDRERKYFKQVLYPVSSPSYMDYNELATFLKVSNISLLRQINIICADLSKYPYFEELVKLLTTFGISVIYHLDGNNFNTVKIISEIAKETKFSIKLYFKNKKDFETIENAIKGLDIPYNWIFLIQDENDWMLSEELTAEYNLDKTDIWPVLTDENINFFEENVFISQDELEDTTLSKQNIFCNQIINSNCWGQLFILPDKKIYGNLNKKPLGTMNDDAMILIRAEINNQDSSWKCTRDKTAPCKDCLYRNLCPPPSNYEFYLNKYDLCTVG